ncbi:hypothetical protein SporoP37_06805 [Sporosarcina sp. P37]|uniref:YusW family protein n=1 Tax=unclassified Sporosarcina TaxID=2647733 RepID=UPI0009BF9EF9|nr:MULTISPECIES: YusW family protein [unclassified Sporosarcina]ARD47876.1 hypothetical protein SporoP33_06325 [Sporosarcina sp. P33]ARK24406.1 hypothetical protein SporoP37_06805 [Sporosarcina sp. P37]PID17572.1 hypothetical protein CSV62_12695 [Sporosarcina sp. P35]
MKRALLTGISVMALSLAACGTDAAKDTGTENKDAASAPVEQPLEPATDETTQNSMGEGETEGSADSAAGNMEADMKQLSFKEIEVEVSYDKDIEYEAEIEQDENEPVKAKVEDEVNNVHLKGQEAFDDIYPKVKQLSLTKDSTNEEAIDQVLKVFNLDANYTKFEVKITFNDGGKLKVEDRK